MKRRDPTQFVFALDVLFFLLMVPVAWVLGCQRKPVRADVTIPLRCLHEMTVTDFSKPCVQVHGKPNEAMCDKVHIRFACVDYSNSGK